VDFDAFWHLHPGWHVTSFDRYSGLLTQGADTLTLASSAPLIFLAPGASPLAVYSPDYGIVEPAPIAQSSTTVRPPGTVATFIPATSAITGNVSVEPVPIEQSAAGWHSAAFRLHWNGGLMCLLTAVESDGVATSHDAAPPGRWGTADVQTDARLALLIDDGRGPAEALLVNGAELHAASERIVSLPDRRALVRVTHLVPAVQHLRGQSRLASPQFPGSGSLAGAAEREAGPPTRDSGSGTQDQRLRTSD
jgi:hypothetical protein